MAAPFLKQHIRDPKGIGNTKPSPRFDGGGKIVLGRLKEYSAEFLLDLKEASAGPGNRYIRKLIKLEIARRKKLGTWIWS